MTRGLAIVWLAFAFSIAGTLFSHLLARDFLDDPGVVRWIAVPVLLATSVVLADHYLW